MPRTPPGWWLTLSLGALAGLAGCSEEPFRSVPINDPTADGGQPGADAPSDAEALEDATSSPTDAESDAGLDGGGAADVQPDSGPDAGEPSFCGGFLGRGCPDETRFYCDYRFDTCGISDESGICVLRPDGCTDVFEPVCGCDGRAFSNACVAAAAGQDLGLGPCPQVDGFFRCGYRYCESATQYCRQDLPGTPDDPRTYSCRTLPSSCDGSNSTCDCLAGEPCAETCETLANGGLQTTCALP